MRLVEARKRMGLNQSQLDDLAGLRRGTTHDIESGRSRFPRWDTVCKLARVLGVDPNWLFPVETEVKTA